MKQTLGLEPSRHPMVQPGGRLDSYCPPAGRFRMRDRETSSEARNDIWADSACISGRLGLAVQWSRQSAKFIPTEIFGASFFGERTVD